MPARPLWLSTDPFPIGPGTLVCPVCRKKVYSFSADDGPTVHRSGCKHLLFLYRFIGVVNETSADYVRGSLKRAFDKACAAAWPRYVRKTGLRAEEGEEIGPEHLQPAEHADFFEEQIDCLAKAVSAPSRVVVVYVGNGDNWDEDVRLGVGFDFGRPIRRAKELNPSALEECIVDVEGV